MEEACVKMKIKLDQFVVVLFANTTIIIGALMDSIQKASMLDNRTKEDTIVLFKKLFSINMAPLHVISQDQLEYLREKLVSWLRTMMTRDKGTLSTLNLTHEFIKYLIEVFTNEGEDTITS